MDIRRDFLDARGWTARHGSSGARLRRVIPVIDALIAAARQARL